MSTAERKRKTSKPRARKKVIPKQPTKPPLTEVQAAREKEDKHATPVTRHWDNPKFKFRPFAIGEVVWLVEYSPLRPAQMIAYENRCLVVKEFNASAPYRVHTERCSYFTEASAKESLTRLRAIGHPLLSALELEYKAAGEAVINHFANDKSWYERDARMTPERDYLEPGFHVRHLKRGETTGSERWVVEHIAEIVGPRSAQYDFTGGGGQSIRFPGIGNGISLKDDNVDWGNLCVVHPPGRENEYQMAYNLWLVAGTFESAIPSDADRIAARYRITLEKSKPDLFAIGAREDQLVQLRKPMTPALRQAMIEETRQMELEAAWKLERQQMMQQQREQQKQQKQQRQQQQQPMDVEEEEEEEEEEEDKKGDGVDGPAIMETFLREYEADEKKEKEKGKKK